LLAFTALLRRGSVIILVLVVLVLVRRRADDPRCLVSVVLVCRLLALPVEGTPSIRVQNLGLEPDFSVFYWVFEYIFSRACACARRACLCVCMFETSRTCTMRLHVLDLVCHTYTRMN
jgi:hypothetical protein